MEYENAMDPILEGFMKFLGPSTPVLHTELPLVYYLENSASPLQRDFIKTQQETTASELTSPVPPLLPIALSSEKDFLDETVDAMELKDFFAKRLQGTEWDTSVGIDSHIQPSPKKQKVLHCQPTTSQNESASSSVPQVIAINSPLIHNSSLNHLGTFSYGQELHTSATNKAASSKRKRDNTMGQPYIKKPPNAFMQFRAEQRQNVMDELHIRNSAQVNMVLGQRWKMLSEQEQAPYFEHAHRMRQAHRAKYSEWSTNGNVANDEPLTQDSRLSNISATNDGASRKKKLNDTEDQPYIKKPPNAFMLFRAEQRQNVVDELHITDSALVNTVLGQRWKMLSEQGQAPYYARAYEEKRAHAAKYPGWSVKDNFGKKSKRKTASIPVAPNYHCFAATVAHAYQPSVMMPPYQTAPLNIPIQAPNSQAWAPNCQAWAQNSQGPSHQATLDDVNIQAPTQELPVTTLTVDGIPTPAILLDDFLNLSPEDQASFLGNHPAPSTLKI